MNEIACTYGDARDEVIVSYLYNELAVDERGAFERHLAACALCRGEVGALRDVRIELKQWSPPEPDFRVPLAPAASAPAVARRSSSWWPDIPTWAQAAAAVLFLGAGAGMANLEISYGPQGLSVNTGWRHAAAQLAPAPPTAAPVASERPAEWRAEMQALEQRLLSELASTKPAAAEPTLRQVRGLVQESEQRQQREVALRLAEMARQVEDQRRADLVRIDRNLGIIQSRTGMEVMRTQQQMNSLAQRVSQQREP